MPKIDNDTLLLAFIAVTGLAVVLQAFILLAILISVRKAARSIKEEIEDLRSAAMPVIYNTRELYQRLAPKVEAATTDLAEMAHNLRIQTADMQSSAMEIVERVRRQSGRLDHMFTGVLDTVERAGNFVSDFVGRPVRQASSLLASIKAAIESLQVRQTADPAKHPPEGRSDEDTDIFF